MSTKNQFLNARLFRTECGPSVHFLYSILPLFLFLCALIFSTLTLKHRLAGDRIGVTIFNDNFIVQDII